MTDLVGNRRSYIRNVSLVLKNSRAARKHGKLECTPDSQKLTYSLHIEINFGMKFITTILVSALTKLKSLLRSDGAVKTFCWDPSRDFSPNLKQDLSGFSGFFRQLRSKSCFKMSGLSGFERFIYKNPLKIHARFERF